MAKKTTKKKAKSAAPGRARNVKQAAPGKSTRKKAAVKKAPAKPAGPKQVSRKSVSKKPVTQKKTTKQSAAKSTPAKPAAKSTTSSKPKRGKALTIVTKKPTRKPQRRAVTMPTANNPRNGQAVKVNGLSERVAKIRESLHRGRENQARVVIESRQLSVEDLKKIKSGLTKKDLDAYRLILMEKRAEILGDVAALKDGSRVRSEGISYEHMADVGTDQYEQEFALELMESERELLERIDDALLRMKQGIYGVCLETGQPIGKARLDAKPWAKYTIDVARDRERRGLPV